MVTRVAVVDDDLISRRGLAAVLSDSAEFHVVATVSHAEALSWSAEWTDVDVALVDAADVRDLKDHFPGVDVVECIREHRSPAETLVIVLTGHAFDTGLQWRMREADADFFYHRTDLADAVTLHRAILEPDSVRRGVHVAASPEELLRLGVRKGSQVNKAVRFSNKASAVSSRDRRRSLHWRREFNREARLRVTNGNGTQPERNQPTPSTPQIDRFIRWATRAKSPPV